MDLKTFTINEKDTKSGIYLEVYNCVQVSKYQKCS